MRVITTAIKFTYAQLEILYDALLEQVAYEHAIANGPDGENRYEAAQTLLHKIESALKKQRGGTEAYGGGYYRLNTEDFRGSA